DGNFPREVLANHNLTFAPYRMPSRRNKADFYDAKKLGPAQPQPGGALYYGTVSHNSKAVYQHYFGFHEFDSITVERPEKFGGDVSYGNFESLESDFSQKKLHPTDLKQAVGESLVKIVSPVREKLALSDELSNLIKNNY
ncbi:MAG: alkyl sulfatase dimerization domain-containing protein, partial [Candidatus Nitrosopelagicus sp.]